MEGGLEGWSLKGLDQTQRWVWRQARRERPGGLHSGTLGFDSWFLVQEGLCFCSHCPSLVAQGGWRFGRKDSAWGYGYLISGMKDPFLAPLVSEQSSVLGISSPRYLSISSPMVGRNILRPGIWCGLSQVLTAHFSSHLRLPALSWWLAVSLHIKIQLFWTYLLKGLSFSIQFFRSSCQKSVNSVRMYLFLDYFYSIDQFVHPFANTIMSLEIK